MGIGTGSALHPGRLRVLGNALQGGMGERERGAVLWAILLATILVVLHAPRSKADGSGEVAKTEELVDLGPSAEQGLEDAKLASVPELGEDSGSVPDAVVELTPAESFALKNGY